MKSSVFVVVGAVVLCAALGCGSDDTDGEGSGGKGGTNSMSSAGSKASAGTSSGGSKANGQAGSAGAQTQAGSAGSSNSGLSEACQKYCDCHDKNCASTPIPDGKSCGEFCTAFSEEQLACRQNMCKLVPDQPDNNHCIHSVGINECL